MLKYRNNNIKAMRLPGKDRRKTVIKVLCNGNVVWSLNTGEPDYSTMTGILFTGEPNTEYSFKLGKFTTDKNGKYFWEID